MGFVYAEIGISNPAEPEAEARLEVLVDAGPMLSVVPRTLLESLGVKPMGQRNFNGFGGIVSRETGVMRVTYDCAVDGATVVFGENDDPAIMGVTALESLGYEVDSVSGKLNPVDILMLSAKQ